jgi:hypothetical protein
MNWHSNQKNYLPQTGHKKWIKFTYYYCFYVLPFCPAKRVEN